MADRLETKYDIRLPLSDLFRWGTEAKGHPEIKEAIHVGPALVGEIPCNHFAFRQEGVDWQIWVQKGDAPLPIKLVITTTDDEARPQFVSVLDWNVAPALSNDMFTFDPPKDAYKIAIKEQLGKTPPRNGGRLMIEKPRPHSALIAVAMLVTFVLSVATSPVSAQRQTRSGSGVAGGGTRTSVNSANRSGSGGGGSARANTASANANRSGTANVNRGANVNNNTNINRNTNVNIDADDDWDGFDNDWDDDWDDHDHPGRGRDGDQRDRCGDRLDRQSAPGELRARGGQRRHLPAVRLDLVPAAVRRRSGPVRGRRPSGLSGAPSAQRPRRRATVAPSRP